MRLSTPRIFRINKYLALISDFTVYIYIYIYCFVFTDKMPSNDKILLRRYLAVLPNLEILNGLWIHVVLMNHASPSKKNSGGCWLDDKWLFTLERQSVSENIFQLFADVHEKRLSGLSTALEFGCTPILRVLTDRIDFFIKGLDFYNNRENISLDNYNDYLVRLVVAPWRKSPWGYGLTLHCDGILPCFKTGVSRRRINKIISEKLALAPTDPIPIATLEQCGICNRSPRVLNYPCGHIYSCQICTAMSGPNCSICRTPLESLVQIFVTWENPWWCLNNNWDCLKILSG
jgi:hypothetical protein